MSMCSDDQRPAATAPPAQPSTRHPHRWQHAHDPRPWQPTAHRPLKLSPALCTASHGDAPHLAPPQTVLPPKPSSQTLASAHLMLLPPSPGPVPTHPQNLRICQSAHAHTHTHISRCTCTYSPQQTKAKPLVVGQCQCTACPACVVIQAGPFGSPTNHQSIQPFWQTGVSWLLVTKETHSNARRGHPAGRQGRGRRYGATDGAVAHDRCARLAPALLWPLRSCVHAPVPALASGFHPAECLGVRPSGCLLRGAATTRCTLVRPFNAQREPVPSNALLAHCTPPRTPSQLKRHPELELSHHTAHTCATMPPLPPALRRADPQPARAHITRAAAA